MNVMIFQCAIVFAFLALGELIVWLTLSLKLGIVRLRHVDLVGNFLVKNLGFFFVPPGVALMLYFDIIEAQLVPIVVASAVSTVIVLVITGWVHQIMRHH